MNIRDYIGKRCLLKISKGYSSDVQEFKIIEVSPSGNWVKLQSNYSGQKFWKQVADIAFVELLQEFESHPIKRAADEGDSPAQMAFTTPEHLSTEAAVSKPALRN